MAGQGEIAEDRLNVVICVDHGTVNGGQAKVAYDNALGLKRAGHRPIVFIAVGPVDPLYSENGIETVCLDQVDLVSNPSKIAGAMQGFWNGRARAELGRLLAGLPRRNTVVHVHSWAKALSPSIARAIAASGLKAVYTVHEYFLWCPNGGFYNYQKRHVCGLKPMGAQCLATHCDSVSYTRKMWRSARLAFANGVLGMDETFSDYIRISQTQADAIAPWLPERARLHRVSNPIDVDDPGPKADPASGAFAFVARISPEKGPFVFAEAARRAGVTALFVGDGPALPALRAQYPEMQYLGWQEAAVARRYLREARALVFPSLWYEGQPLTVLEAKASGTPVIVSDVCAGRESVVDGEMGLWFRSQDAADLARCIETLKDDAIVARMSRAAYEDYWREPLTLERHTANVLGVYRSMLSGQSPDA